MHAADRYQGLRRWIEQRRVITLVKGYQTRVVSCYSNFIRHRMSIKAWSIIQITVSKKRGVKYLIVFEICAEDSLTGLVNGIHFQESLFGAYAVQSL